MRIKNPIPKHVPKHQYLMKQKIWIEENFDYLKCNIVPQKNLLCCKGCLQPAGAKQPYHVKVEYVVGREPKTTVLSPRIEPSHDIHMYQDHSLCLSYSKDMLWTEITPIYEFTIPWIGEWIVYYELYLVNGNKWEGPESNAHMTERDKVEVIDK